MSIFIEQYENKNLTMDNKIMKAIKSSNMNYDVKIKELQSKKGLFKEFKKERYKK